jgi:hypothetical protein
VIRLEDRNEFIDEIRGLHRFSDNIEVLTVEESKSIYDACPHDRGSSSQ